MALRPVLRSRYGTARYDTIRYMRVISMKVKSLKVFALLLGSCKIEKLHAGVTAKEYSNELPQESIMDVVVAAILPRSILVFKFNY